MAFADYVQSASKDAGSTTSSTLVFGSSITAGNTIIVAVRRSTGTIGTVTVSDDVNAGNYTQDANVETADPHGDYMFRKSNVAAGTTTVTVAFDTAKNMRFAIGEYVGNFVVDGTPPTGTGSSTAPSSGNGTTTASDCIVGSISSSNNVGGTLTPGSGWTSRQSVGAPFLIAFLDRNGAQVAGTYSMNGTISATETWGAIMVGYSAAGGAVAPASQQATPLFGPGSQGPLAWQWQQQHGVDSSGVVFTITPSGSVSASGALTNLTSKSLAGSSTGTGALAKLASKALAGSSTPSGALAKLISKAFAGSSTATGTLSTIKVVLRAFGGSVTASGALAKQVAKALAGTSSPSGTVAKQDAKALAGSVTPTGAMAKLVKKAFAGSSTASGALATVRVILRSFGGSVTASGTLARQAQKAFTGSTAPSGTVAKQTSKALVGSVTATGALSKLAKKVFVGTLTAVGTLATALAGAQLPAVTREVRVWRIDNRRGWNIDHRRTWRITGVINDPGTLALDTGESLITDDGFDIYVGV